MGDPTADFQQKLRGQLIRSGDADYDSARALYNGMIDKRPRLIARCTDVADVIAAVNFGREQGLLIAIRGGGHNGPGLGSCDDGLMIDLSMMKGVRVDPAGRTVRVDPGCTSGDVDHATHAFGLAVPFGIVSTTGVSGLTLGGGTGYLTRKYGLDDRQPAGSGRRPGRRQRRHHQPERASGSVLGAARRWRQLRRRHELPVPGASGRDGLRRSDLLECHRRKGGDARLPRLLAGSTRGTRRIHRAQDRAVDGSVSARLLGQTRLCRHLPVTAARKATAKRQSARCSRLSRRRSSTGWASCRSRCSRRCSTRSFPRAFSGTGRATL